MNVPAGMSRKPLSDAFGFVSRVVVHHEMKVEFARRGAFQVAEEFEQFVLRMTLVALAIDLTGFRIQLPNSTSPIQLPRQIIRAPFKSGPADSREGGGAARVPAPA